jgi:hypothetical protein
VSEPAAPALARFLPRILGMPANKARVGGVVLVLLGLGFLGPPTSFTWSRRKAVISLIAFAFLGGGLIAAGGASLAGLLGPTEPGGVRTNDFAAVTICFGAVALAFSSASYRSILRMR